MTILRNKGLLIAAMAFSIILTGCDYSTQYYLQSYVQAYSYVGYLSVNPSVSGHGQITVSYGCPRQVSFKSEGEDKHLYDSLCVAHNDISYNRSVWLMLDMINIYCPTPNMVKYEVTSNLPFDSDHPSGSSLNDLVTIKYRSLKQYIDSGYAEEYNIYGRGVEITKKLSEMTPEDMQLMLKSFGDIRFTKKPDEPCVHTITVSLTGENGRIYSDTIDYDFTK